MSNILFPGPHGSHLLGGKANALAELSATQFSIPSWFVVSPLAFKSCISEEQYHELTVADEIVQFQTILDQLVLSDDFRAALNKAMSQLCPVDEPVAVRSSAVDEDGENHSFAGQLESYLFVDKATVAQRVVDVWRSGFSERVLSYRQEAGLSLMPEVPAVLIQRMIDADVSGVAFAADPVTGHRSVAVIGALYGLGTALVSGDVDADTFRVDLKNNIIQRDIAEKRLAHHFDNSQDEGVSAKAVADEKINQASLNDAQVLAVADLVRATSQHFNCPQDIEWAYHQDKLYLLQSRPITSLADMADPEGALNIWDNSNIAESYGGVTTPLTFSFASKAYEEVYRQFCRILKVPSHVIDDNDTTYRRMLGLIRGRVYYNMLSWYRVLAMLPGFAFNRPFMEQMMGVKEGLPDAIVSELNQASGGARFRDGLNLLTMFSGLIVSHFTLPKTIDRFYARLNKALKTDYQTLSTLRADALCHHYHELEQQLLTRWDAPLVNDFFAMIFHGVLSKLTVKWCHDKDNTLHNDLLCGEGGMISAEPAQRVRTMAKLLIDDTAMIDLLCDANLTDIHQAISERPVLAQHIEDYLNKFGDRCLDELKLESITLHDDPGLLFCSVGQLAKRLQTDPNVSGNSVEATIRAQAEQKVIDSLGNKGIKKSVFNWVLKHARHRVRDRENLRFERTRLFGHVRRIFVELGKRFTDVDMLTKPKDIFYLEVNEIMGVVEGTTSLVSLKGLIALRRAEFDAYETMPAPADRFDTYGIVHHGNRFESAHAPEETEGDFAKGIACCPGIVRGPVRVITDPRNAKLKAGEILVAERTDPGWIMLFPSASALLVERGSLLSHSAIVAREMGIPAIVSISGVTRWLKDGDWVEMDGSRGTVRRIEAEDSL